MKSSRLKLARIGNSRGVRIPAATLERYGFKDGVAMEERSDGILLRPVETTGDKLSWEDTAVAMSREAEEWADWDVTVGDGMSELAWQPQPAARRVAEPSPAARKGRTTKRAK